MDSFDRDNIRQHFRCICKECGSENVEFYYQKAHSYSEYTVDPPVLSIGCNDCKKNDVRIYL